MQKITLIGNLGKDPEARFTPSGVPVTNFSVATDRVYTNAAGEKVTVTQWFRITTWNKLAENCQKYLAKGKKVYVEGRMNDPKPYQNAAGELACSLEITAEVVLFLSPATGGPATSEEAGPTGPVEEVIPFGQPEAAPASLPC